MAKTKAKRTPGPITWLHLSDLHLGCPGKALWWQVADDFSSSLREQVERIGLPDLILITGDLAFKGAKKEYDQADQFLADLKKWLREAGGKEDPLVIPIPGNHDLARPKGEKAYPYMVLDQYGNLDDERVADFKKKLWQGKTTPALINTPFREYSKWLDRSIKPQFAGSTHKTHYSRIPGDVFVQLSIRGKVPLNIVGLNSAWMQYADGPFEKRLELPLEQFLLALPQDGKMNPLDVFSSNRPALLMMHHPPDWLSPASLEAFNSEIFRPDRFDLCLFGHLHRGRSETSKRFGGEARHYFQSPSLFGVKHYGKPKEERRFGFSFGRLAADGEIMVWPLERKASGGTPVFVPDSQFKNAGDPEGVQLRPPTDPAPKKGPVRRKKMAPVKRKADFTLYLKTIIDDTDHINIKGIGSGRGESANALRYPIEKLYVPLRSHTLPSRETDAVCASSPKHRKAGRGPGKRPSAVEPDSEYLSMLGERGEGRVALSKLLPSANRLLVEGQPGSGKTTFLRFVACMLARDRLVEPCPEGSSWSTCYLGLDPEKEPLTPVLLRISDLAEHLDALPPGSLRRDDHGRLVDMLASYAAGNKLKVTSRQWQTLLESGKAILLLDGLDEVADEKLRQRIFTIFRDACRKWAKTRIVVTSRPIQTAALREIGFGHVTIEDFGKNEIRTFIQHWVSALHQVDAAQPLTASAIRYQEKLLTAIEEQARIRLLAANPVMLTCLCVVHWNEGRLPEGRSRVYRAVLRWLVNSRTTLRRAEGFTNRFALRGFALIALGMMRTKLGKQAVIDLEQGARLVEPLIQRDYPELKSAEERRELGRRWLRAECLHSAIVEEVSGNRIRFWHLTFQEYLAARQLAWLGDGLKEIGTRSSTDLEENWWPIVRDQFHNSQWRETVDLLPGCLLDEGGEGRVDLLLERVLDTRGTKPSLAKEALVVGVMGRLLQPLDIYDYNPKPEINSTHQQTLKRALDIFTIEGSKKVAVKQRIEAAEALGRGGDPRLAPGKNNYLEIPGMPGLRLGKYLVTVEEYQRFIDARGYEETRFWLKAGWQIRKEKNWERPNKWDQQIQAPNRPVVYVSWYEAIAFCQWLREVSDREARLPSKTERIAAAIPQQGRYPWGAAEPDEEKANFGQNVGEPTPVGIYPQGAGPAGHLDLAGNVWEWCADETAMSKWIDGFNKRHKGRNGSAPAGREPLDRLQPPGRFFESPAPGRAPDQPHRLPCIGHPRKQLICRWLLVFRGPGAKPLAALCSISSRSIVTTWTT